MLSSDEMYGVHRFLRHNWTLVYNHSVLRVLLISFLKKLFSYSVSTVVHVTVRATQYLRYFNVSFIFVLLRVRTNQTFIEKQHNRFCYVQDVGNEMVLVKFRVRVYWK